MAGVDVYDAFARNKLKESMFNNLRITLRFVIVLSAFWLLGAVVIAVSYWGLRPRGTASKPCMTVPWFRP